MAEGGSRWQFSFFFIYSFCILLSFLFFTTLYLPGFDSTDVPAYTHALTHITLFFTFILSRFWISLSLSLSPCFTLFHSHSLSLSHTTKQIDNVLHIYRRPPRRPHSPRFIYSTWLFNSLKHRQVKYCITIISVWSKSNMFNPFGERNTLKRCMCVCLCVLMYQLCWYHVTLQVRTYKRNHVDHLERSE